LDNNGLLSASTKLGEGGNINLQVRNTLVLRNDSLISAEAGGRGNGGNIAIDTSAIVALENSDIVANAFQGNGGNILITANSIFGTAFRPQLTPESDITASSQFGVNGIVQINNPDVDPGGSLAQLPEDVTDPSQQIATGCSALQESSFVVTGRGGLPPNPSEQLDSTRTWSDVRDLSAFRSSENVVAESEPANPPVIVEATGWMVNEAGNVELVATVPQVGAPINAMNCTGTVQ
jgi:large exoprotein involved in heme utilization and adhesion